MYDMLQMLPKIVNMTLAASFAGCVVLLLRAVLRKVPAGYFYALWLMVFQMCIRDRNGRARKEACLAAVWWSGCSRISCATVQELSLIHILQAYQPLYWRYDNKAQPGNGWLPVPLPPDPHAGNTVHCIRGNPPGPVSYTHLIPYAGSPDLPAGYGTEQEGEAVLYVCLHA